MKKEITKHILTLAGVEIIGKVKDDDDINLSKLETVTSILQNAFIPKYVKEELNNEVKGETKNEFI